MQKLCDFSKPPVDGCDKGGFKKTLSFFTPTDDHRTEFTCVSVLGNGGWRSWGGVVIFRMIYLKAAYGPTFTHLIVSLYSCV